MTSERGRAARIFSINRQNTAVLALPKATAQPDAGGPPALRRDCLSVAALLAPPPSRCAPPPGASTNLSK
jgi:hypothetical protein